MHRKIRPLRLACLLALPLAMTALPAAASFGDPAEERPAQPAPAERHGAADARLDRALAEADTTIRDGVLKLAKDYPQLAQSNSGTLADALKGKSDAGALTIYAAHYHGAKGGVQTPVKSEDAYSVVVILQPPPDPGAPQPQMVYMTIYPNLNLAGQVNVSAGDPKLDAALKKLVKDALEPIGKLEAEAAQKPKH